MLDTLEAALEPLALKTGKVFSGEVVAVLAPSHGHVPLYRCFLTSTGRFVQECLYSREQFDALPLQPSPEMQRCDLAQSCLQAVALGRHPQVFLASAIDPPGVAAVETAMEQLVGINAVDNSDSDPEVCPVLLPIGEVLARLPLEPLLGRAALLGCILGIPEQSAALLAQRAFCAWSDPLAAAKALLQWEKLTSDPAAANQWAEEKHLSTARLANLSRDKAFLLRERCGIRMGG
eukprot:s2577_g6.t1